MVKVETFYIEAKKGYKNSKHPLKITDSHLAELDRSIRLKIAQNEENRAKDMKLAMLATMG